MCLILNRTAIPRHRARGVPTAEGQAVIFNLFGHGLMVESPPPVSSEAAGLKAVVTEEAEDKTEDIDNSLRATSASVEYAEQQRPRQQTLPTKKRGTTLTTSMKRRTFHELRVFFKRLRR